MILVLLLAAVISGVMGDMVDTLTILVIVLLEAGNQIPADLRLLEIAQLRVDESALTGESVTVEKHSAPLTGMVHALGDRLNMGFKGTTATHGRGRGLVVATGMATELGKVAGLLDRDSERSTPLQLRLAAFGKRLALVVIAICVLVPAGAGLGLVNEPCARADHGVHGIDALPDGACAGHSF
jgi:magnesium-transporting ATPase (P-type)